MTAAPGAPPSPASAGYSGMPLAKKLGIQAVPTWPSGVRLMADWPGWRHRPTVC